VDAPRSQVKLAVAAWEAVYESARPSLVRALTAATGSYDGVEDAIQDAFGEALRRSPSELANVEGWLFAVALAQLRSHRRRARILRRLGLMTPSRESELDRALQGADIRRVLDALTRRERELLIAMHYIGMTQEQIVSYMRAPGGTVPAANGLATALDALPVPEEPTGFGATDRPSLVRDVRVLLAAVLLLVLVATLTSPQFQQTAAEMRRYIGRTVFGPAWAGYYIDSVGTSASGRPVFRLLVASEGLQAPATPVLVGDRPDHGQWSPDRQSITVSTDSQLYVGDRSGRLRPVADIGAGYIVVESGWIGNGMVWAAAAANNAPRPPLLVTVDLKTGALERRVLDNIGGAGLAGTISPDGRWLSLFVQPAGNDDACRNFGKLYDLAASEVVDVLDGHGAPASLSYGFLSDGRIVVAQCDRFAHTLELYVGAPGARPSLIAVVPITVRYPLVTSSNGNDEILVIASGPDAPQSAYVFDPSGRLLRRVPLPQFAAHGTTDVFGDLSHDGTWLGFVVNEPRREPFAQFVTRAGVVDLTTGHVAYLCDGGCFWLLLP
jgi:DNA-directed RNA polymerase specialized sigma24 family protein